MVCYWCPGEPANLHHELAQHHLLHCPLHVIAICQELAQTEHDALHGSVDDEL